MYLFTMELPEQNNSSRKGINADKTGVDVS
jgi:hypothetical protein